MEHKKESLQLAGQIDLSNAIRHLTDNKDLKSKVFDALHRKFILGQEPENLSPETKAFFEKFQYYVKQDPVAEYKLFEELQEVADQEEQREVLQEKANEIRNRISFLEQAGQEPVQWLEELERKSDVMSQILDLNPGDKMIVDNGLFADKNFTITKHNRMQRVIIAEDETGERKVIRYANPSVLEDFVQDVKEVIVLRENKPLSSKANKEIETYLSKNSWEIEQLRRKSKKKAA